MDFKTELVPDTEIVTLVCPVKRLMNTQDYSDAKVEIGLFYTIQGFYTIVGPEIPGTNNRAMTYGKGEEMTIEILDGGLCGLYMLPLLIGSMISALLFV